MAVSHRTVAPTGDKDLTVQYLLDLPRDQLKATNIYLLVLTAELGQRVRHHLQDQRHNQLVLLRHLPVALMVEFLHIAALMVGKAPTA